MACSPFLDGVGALTRLRGAESKDTQRSFPIRRFAVCPYQS